MMKPKIEDVVEYVRDGEKDPGMKAFLDFDANGAELLKQARFIIRMLNQKFEGSTDIGMVADAAAPKYLSEPAAADLQTPTFSVESTSKKSIGSRPSKEKVISRSDHPSEDLGTLEFAAEGERVTLSYLPSKAAMRHIKKLGSRFPLGETGAGGIEIHGARITLFLPGTISVTEKVPLEVSFGARRMPAVGQQMIFMPDSGPFLRLETDDEGRLLMPVPERNGTLRIDAGRPQILRIEKK